MWRLLFFPLFASCAAAPEPAGERPSRRPVHTYSIVARDEATGQIGVAVQSHWFAVGSLVPWASAGVGAVATQSFVNPRLGPQGLELMRTGRSPEKALPEMMGADPGAALRQVALVDAKGRAAAHTGGGCIPDADHVVGRGYAVAANIMRNDSVVPAMARAFEASSGPLAERLLTVLEAAQASGGDLRGQQSAALLVVASTHSGDPERDVLVDLRVDDHPRPLEELRRLYALHRAYEHMNDGDAALERGDTPAALREYGRAEELAPDVTEITFWRAVTMASSGSVEAALPLFRRAFEENPDWAELLRRLPFVGLLDPKLAETIRTRCGLR